VSRGDNETVKAKANPQHDSKRRNQSFDIPAALSFTSAVLFLQMGVTWGLLHEWRSPATFSFFALVPFLLLFFVIWELEYSKAPIIDLSLFYKNTAFAGSVVSAFLQSLALFSANFLLIFYLEGIYGLSVLHASYLLVPMAVANAVVGPFAGRLTDKIGVGIIASLGITTQAIALILLSRLGPSTTLWYVGVVEMFYGIGGGLFWPANTSAIMSAAPKEAYGAASGIMNTFRNTGMIMSFALSLTAATSAIPASLVYKLFLGNFQGKLSASNATSYLSGQRFAFEISAALLVMATFISVLTGKIRIRHAK
jgi:MFS family permease